MRKLLITGQTGFVGQHIQAHLINGLAADWQLLPSRPHDLLHPESLDAWLTDPLPDAVIHLAGQTYVPEAFRDPAQTLQTNLIGTLNLLQALKRRGFQGTFLYVSSGDVYGQVAPEHLPINETLLPHPRNPYAVSKLAAETLCLQWSYCEPDWRILVARPFNHVGPGQAVSFVLPGMAQQLIRIRHGLQPPELLVGDVDVTRDFLDVRDVVRAYFCLLEQGRTGEVYNLCSGIERSIRDLILQMADLAQVTITLVEDTARLRRAEQRRVVGSAARLHEQTGWQPELPIITTLTDVLADLEKRDVK